VLSCRSFELHIEGIALISMFPGDTVFVSPALSMRVEEVFPNADQYNPERFVEEDKQTQKYRFLGFGAGRHGCMGENFAYLQIKTIWSVLLRNFDIELVGELPKPDYTAMVVGACPNQLFNMRNAHIPQISCLISSCPSMVQVPLTRAFSGTPVSKKAEREQSHRVPRQRRILVFVFACARDRRWWWPPHPNVFTITRGHLTNAPPPLYVSASLLSKYISSTPAEKIRKIRKGLDNQRTQSEGLKKRAGRETTVDAHNAPSKIRHIFYNISFNIFCQLFRITPTSLRRIRFIRFRRFAD